MHNELGQPIGTPVRGWKPRPRPAEDLVLEGRTCRLERLHPDRHVNELWDAYAADTEGRLWTYMPNGPFGGRDEYREWARGAAAGTDPFFLAVIDAATGRATGVASYLDISPDWGSIEVGWIAYSPALQRTTAATEAMALMMGHAFDDLGYRRYAWRCNALNARSRTAAERLGFTFEGIFRQAMVVKGHNRDTAWYSIIDSDWPAVRAAFERWLRPANFGRDGRQLESLRIER